jgi:hypothetical protein
VRAAITIENGGAIAPLLVSGTSKERRKPGMRIDLIVAYG